MERLGAETEVDVLLVAGVGVHIVGGSAVELVSLAEFTADKEAESYGAEASGDPTNGLDEGRFFFLFVVAGLLRKWEGAADSYVFGFVIVAGFRTEHHDIG
jgi:hypothetical protein